MVPEKPNAKTEKTDTPPEEPKLPPHVEAFKKLKKKIEKAEGTDFKTFLQTLKAR